MRIKQAARRLGVHPNTLKRLKAQHGISVRRDRNGQRRYTLEDLKHLEALYYPMAAPFPVGQEDHR